MLRTVSHAAPPVASDLDTREAVGRPQDRLCPAHFLRWGDRLRHDLVSSRRCFADSSTTIPRPIDRSQFIAPAPGHTVEAAWFVEVISNLQAR